MEFERVKVSVSPKRRGHCHHELDIGLIDIAYYSSHEDYDDEGIGAIRGRPPRDDLMTSRLRHRNLMATSTGELY